MSNSNTTDFDNSSFISQYKTLDIVSIIVRSIIGFVFILAAVGKINSPSAFLLEIHNYDMTPDFLERILALWLPWLELVSGVLLIFGLKVRANSAIIGTLLIIFTIGVAVAWGRGLEINCGCFGNMAEQKVGLPKILENTAMIIGSAFVFWRAGSKSLVSPNNSMKQ